MSSSRVQPPQVNLKERIAALQQRSGTSPSGPSPSLIPVPTGSKQHHAISQSSPTQPSVGALREKIARFEKKGGIPVPRGSFGLGAPPPTDTGAQRRKGELYGNRIPQPVRVVSGPGPQRAASPLGYNYPTGAAAAEKRRSFSLSGVTTTGIPRFSGAQSQDGSGTPLTSPELSTSSPELPSTTSTTTNGSPHPPSTFTRALEFAKSVEMASLQETEAVPGAPSPPAIIVSPESSFDLAPVKEVEEAVIEQPETQSTIHNSNPSDSSPSILPATLPSLVRPPPVEFQPATITTTINTSDINDITDTDNYNDATENDDDPGQLAPSAIQEKNQASTVVINGSPSPKTRPTSFGFSSLPVPSSHKVLLRAAGLGSPLTESLSLSSSVIQPLTPETVLSDDDDDDERSVAIIIGLPAVQPILELSAVEPKEEEAEESEVEEEKVVSRLKAAPPPALELSNASVPSSPEVGSAPRSEDDNDSLEEKTDNEEDADEGQELDIPIPKVEVDNYDPPEAPHLPDTDTIPSSPTTPHAPTFSFTIDTTPTSDISPPTTPTSPSPSFSIPYTQTIVSLQSPSSPVSPTNATSLSPPSPPPSSSSSLLSLSPSRTGTPTFRPMSMIEFTSTPSPSHVAFAERVMPTMGRGVPMYLPPTESGVREEDLVYYPETPPGRRTGYDDDEEVGEGEGEEGVEEVDSEVSGDGDESTEEGEHRELDDEVPPTPPPKEESHKPRIIDAKEEETEQEEQGEPGSVTILPNGSGRKQPATFTAIVHRKVREIPGSNNNNNNDNHNSLLLSNPHSHTPVRRVVSAQPIMNGVSPLPAIPTSPGFMDLSDLIQSTVLLEKTLERGDLPTEGSGVSASASSMLSSGVPLIVTHTDSNNSGNGLDNERVGDGRWSREEVEENRRTLSRIQAKREEQAKSKIRNGLKNGFGLGGLGGLGFGGRSREEATASMYGDSTSVAAVQLHQQHQQQQQQYYSKRFKSPSVPHLLDSVREDPRSQTPEDQLGSSHKPPSVMSKSPKSRFSSFRRLANRSSPGSLKDGNGHGHGGPRNSVSTQSSELSSEDSSSAGATTTSSSGGLSGAGVLVTPPDVGSDEFGVSWPSMSSPSGRKEGRVGGKDGGAAAAAVGGVGNNHIARAATFAGKIWQRARTKSGTSTMSGNSSTGRLSSEPAPVLPPLPNITLNSTSTEIDGEILNDRKPPFRSTSLGPRSASPALPPLPPKSADLSLSFDLNPTNHNHGQSRSSTPQPRYPHLSPENSPSSSAASMYASHMQQRRCTSGPPPASTTTNTILPVTGGNGGGSSPSALRPNSSLSWVSVSSSNSNFNSSLLDSELFDAFPSVPENHPLIIPPSPSSLPASTTGAGYPKTNLNVPSSSPAVTVAATTGPVVQNLNTNVPWLMRSTVQGQGTVGTKQ